jgi:predicted TIM-barrel fold metal-dependent hydrolase
MPETVIDADGHIIESDRELYEYLEPPYAGHEYVLGFPFFPTLDGWHRGAVLTRIGVHKHKFAVNARVWGEVLDRVGYEWSVLYPTAGLGYGLVTDPEWAVALARAYNSWLTDRFTRLDGRLRGMALVPLQEPAEAVKELRRAVGELGMAGAVLPAYGWRHHLGHESYFPLYEAAQELDVPVAIHGAVTVGLGFGIFEHFAAINALGHPIGQMMQMTAIALAGILDRFPRLRLGFLEAGATWALYMMDRLDRAVAVWQGEKRTEFARAAVTPFSEHLRGGRVFFSIEPEERLLPLAVGELGAGSFLYASDFPHEANLERIAHDLAELSADPRFDGATRQQFFRDNARRFYGRGLPAGR